MNSAYDLYGAKELSLQGAKAFIERALGAVLEERESSYQGGIYYILGDSVSEHFILKLNVDPFDGEAAECDFSDYTVLLYVNDTFRASDIEMSIGREYGFELLRHEVF